jgi:hypothetical protein
MYTNTVGFNNTASGLYSLRLNTSGSNNAAFGLRSMYSNTTGTGNVSLGQNALYANSTGSDNIAIGNESGSGVTGSNNIDIGAVGVQSDSGIIRIGTAGTHSSVYLSGVNSTQITGAPVYVSASGQLGVLASSERYKTAIAPMAGRTDQLQRLRPVTFHLKSEPNGAVQYGLVAEEVAKIYPELVIRDAAGNIQGVRYDELAPMLLNEVQQLQTKVRQMDAQLRNVESLEKDIAQLKALVAR